MVKEKANNSKQISFGHLVWEALPEMWNFKFVTIIVLIIFAGILNRFGSAVISTSGETLTTANLRAVLIGWRGPVLLLIGAAIVILYIVMEIFAQIFFAGDILGGHQTGMIKDTARAVKRSILTVRRFFTPAGIPILIYIFIAVPLVGLGFSISLTSTFHIPDFIMEVVQSTPVYSVLYFVGILALFILGIRYIFSVHGVILGGLSPRDAKAQSVNLLKKNKCRFFIGMIKVFIIAGIFRWLGYVLFEILPEAYLTAIGDDSTSSYFVDIEAVAEGTLSDMDLEVIIYRIACVFAIMVGGYLHFIVNLLTSAYIMLSFTRYYMDFSSEEASVKKRYPARPKRNKYLFKAAGAVLVGVVLAVASAVVGVAYSYLAEMDEPVKIVAHRTGGYLASENSIEGIERAIEYDCYGSETDVQRTKDGHYIICHDDTFKRLTGVDKAPSEMTLDEIKELKIKSTMGNGEILEVPTIEELLETSKGRIKLFIELKGKTADYQMVDDLVQIIRDMDCVDDVALISLNYDVINYAETNYPEFETGVLFFASFGNLGYLNADMLMMEDESATADRIFGTHVLGKQVVVWTPNTEETLMSAVSSMFKPDAVITDNVQGAKQAIEDYESLGEYDRIYSWLSSVWK